MGAPAVDNEVFEAATAIGREASEYVRDRFQDRSVRVDFKADGSEVTNVDRGAEDLVRQRIAELFPTDGIVGEEREPVVGSSGRTWIVDPIDGTTSFVRGVPLFATLLAVTDKDGPAVGFISCPALDEHVLAGRGRGCTHNQTSAQVSTVELLAESCLSSSSFDGSWWPEDALLAVANSGAKTRTWGDGYGYLLVATGRIEAMVEPALNVWDIAPMLVVIPEAGGTITNWDGKTQLSSGSGWVASNSHIHTELIDLINPR